MGRRLVSAVHVRHPKSHEWLILQPGDEPDEDLAAVIENPGAGEEDEESDPDPDPDPGPEPEPEPEPQPDPEPEPEPEAEPEAEPEDEPEAARPPRRGTRKPPQ
jgi:hypothetical protein